MANTDRFNLLSQQESPYPQYGITLFMSDHKEGCFPGCNYKLYSATREIGGFQESGTISSVIFFLVPPWH